jgi:hypothetical protein
VALAVAAVLVGAGVSGGVVGALLFLGVVGVGALSVALIVR